LDDPEVRKGKKEVGPNQKKKKKKPVGAEFERTPRYLNGKRLGKKKRPSHLPLLAQREIRAQ